MDEVLIVGGGLAGLATAVALVDAGRRPCVLEKRAVLGGKVSSWRDADGDAVESGLHIFFGSYTHLLALLRRVGAAGHIAWKDHTIYVARPGGQTATFRFPPWPAPFNGLVAFGTTDLFSFGEKLTNMRALIRPWLMGVPAIGRWDALSYAQWHRRFGIAPGVLDKWWNPIALSMGFLPAAELSARPMTTVFHHFARSGPASRVGFLDGCPADRLHRPLVDYITARGGRVETGVRAAGLELGPDGQVAGLRLSDGGRRVAAHYVLATPLHSTRLLLPPTLRHFPQIANLWRLKSVPVMNVQIWFDRYVSTVDNLFFTADAPFSVFADLAVVAPQEYDRHGGSLLSMAVAPAAPLWPLPDAEIIARCRAALARLWPTSAAAAVRKATLVRIPNSIYRESPGSDRYRPAQRTPLANLFLAGDYTRQDYMASMEGAVRSGTLAARALLERR
ncbi:MAG TPA: FAD-dependent oxidoreductase [Chloroflexia bacterium]|nr:FAD-dependent oxidoreductase [Chloroflexia bacterium]